MDVRTEHNLIVLRSGKSEAEVPYNRRLGSMYFIIKASYRVTRSIARPLCDSRATCIRKLSCRRETARCFVSLIGLDWDWLIISLSHSRLLKVIWN